MPCSDKSKMNMKKNMTKDPVNQHLIDELEECGVEQLGVMNSSVWRNEPQRLVFTLSRYKFVGKMLVDRSNVLEVGCGDGFGARIVRQHVKSLHITDADEYFIRRFQELYSRKWAISCSVHDMISSPTDLKYDALYSLDVLEHIDRRHEDAFMTNICGSLSIDGVAIIGMPSLESQKYAFL